MMTALGIVGSLTLFLILGTAFVAGHLMLGRFLRPKNPTPEKLAIYECGEPTIGTSFVQFDLRFYVIALVFIIFEVEAAFFFPWAVIAGQAAELSDPVHIASAEALARTTTPKNSPVDDTDPPADEQTVALWRQLASGSQRRPVPKQDVPPPPQTPSARDDVAGVVAGPVNSHAPFSAISSQRRASRLLKIALVDMGVFFVVLLVGFAYVWKRGDLDWVRSYQRSKSAARWALALEPHQESVDRQTV